MVHHLGHKIEDVDLEVVELVHGSRSPTGQVVGGEVESDQQVKQVHRMMPLMNLIQIL